MSPTLESSRDLLRRSTPTKTPVNSPLPNPTGENSQRHSRSPLTHSPRPTHNHSPYSPSPPPSSSSYSLSPSPSIASSSSSSSNLDNTGNEIMLARVPPSPSPSPSPQQNEHHDGHHGSDLDSSTSSSSSSFRSRTVTSSSKLSPHNLVNGERRSRLQHDQQQREELSQSANTYGNKDGGIEVEEDDEEQEKDLDNVITNFKGDNQYKFHSTENGDKYGLNNHRGVNRSFNNSNQENRDDYENDIDDDGYSDNDDDTSLNVNLIRNNNPSTISNTSGASVNNKIQPRLGRADKINLVSSNGIGNISIAANTNNNIDAVSSYPDQQNKQTHAQGDQRTDAVKANQHTSSTSPFPVLYTSSRTTDLQKPHSLLSPITKNADRQGTPVTNDNNKLLGSNRSSSVLNDKERNYLKLLNDSNHVRQHHQYRHLENNNTSSLPVLNTKTSSIMTAMSSTTPTTPRNSSHMNTTINGHTTSSPTSATSSTNGGVSLSPSGDDEREASYESSLQSRRPSRKTSDPNHVSHQFFHLEPCLYTHRMFERAARIFAVLKHDDADTEEKKALRRRTGGDVGVGSGPPVKEKIPDMDFIDSQEQIKTFELTFATLKFQKLFSSILDYIGFFHKYSNLNDHYSLVYVILHDLQTRKFQRRTVQPGEQLDAVCSEVEEALLIEKTRLLANIAKERIKHHAPTVDFLLPEHVRNKDETKARTPVYMWVNQMKTTINNMVVNLKADGFQLMDAGTDMSEVTDHAFLIDPHCPDVLTFPPHLNMELKASDMVKSGLLVQQDKSSCLAPQTVTHLLGNDNDVIHVNIGTAMTTCHLASLLRHTSPQSHIWAFGVNGPQKVSKVLRTMEFLEVKNVKLVTEEFLSVDPEESKYKGVRIILISANCSKSAITSPVQFIVSEGEDTQILGELSVGEADMNHVRDLMVDHERLLKHALKFPKLQAVVYTTRSRFELENETVITKVLEFMSMTNNKKNTFKVAPPVLPFSIDEINTGKGGVDGRYLRFLPSDKANGCFVAIIAREPEETKETFSKKKSKLGKSKSGPNPGSNGSQKQRKSLKGGTASLPAVAGIEAEDNEEGDTPGTPTTSKSKTDSGSALRQKISQHKSPAAVGARLYQNGVIKKMEKAARTTPSKPEHLKVIKHPSPFRETPRSTPRNSARSRPSRSQSGSRSTTTTPEPSISQHRG